MIRKTLLALSCLFAMSAVAAVDLQISEAAEPGVMICRTKVDGVWKGDSCTTVRPSAPCGQIDVCDGCGCWDVSASIDPNSRNPDKVGSLTRKKARAKEEIRVAP